MTNLMRQPGEVLQSTEGDTDHLFYCPGCDMPHSFDKRWKWNGSRTKPTFQPSLLVRWDEGEKFTKKVCHSFVTDGQIQFLGDCTHALAGKTVPLPTWEEVDRKYEEERVMASKTKQTEEKKPEQSAATIEEQAAATTEEQAAESQQPLTDDDKSKLTAMLSAESTRQLLDRSAFLRTRGYKVETVEEAQSFLDARKAEGDKVLAGFEDSFVKWCLRGRPADGSTEDEVAEGEVTDMRGQDFGTDTQGTGPVLTCPACGAITQRVGKRWMCPTAKEGGCGAQGVE